MQVRLVLDDDARVARLFVNRVDPEWFPIESEILLHTPEEEQACPYTKHLSEEEQEALQWFWYDMGFGPA